MIKKITRDELVDMICNNENLRIVDVLDSAHFEQEHIKGAISLPLAEIEKRVGEVLRKDENIVVYCANFQCAASTSAAQKLMSMGFTNVVDYKGGISDYKEAGLPLEGSLHKEESRSFPCEYATCGAA